MSDTSTIRGEDNPGNPWSIADRTSGRDGPRPRAALNPTLLAYVMAPVALLVILLLMRAGVAVRVHANATVSRLRKLKDIGVMIAIDDFGTGYSSLAYLRQFPVDVLKIDQSFVAEMDGSTDSAALIHTLAELSRTLGLVTLAEGIEEPAQLDILRGEQCDSGQGFISSRPVDPEAIVELLARPVADLGVTPSPGRTEAHVDMLWSLVTRVVRLDGPRPVPSEPGLLEGAP